LIDLNVLLDRMMEMNASDLHLTVGAPPVYRINGVLTINDNSLPLLNPEDTRDAVFSILTQKQRKIFEDELELDISYSLLKKARFRVNVYLQRGSVGAAFRLIPFDIKSVEELNLPLTLKEFAKLPRGLVLVTGPTGTGKTTTLASIIDLINNTRTDHIITIEDPIEFIHHHKKCIVNQREIGSDTGSFSNALRHALRQDPDVILVGEMRDLDTISTTITAAETGHLVFATLHTVDAAQTVDRIIDVFPPYQQQQVRIQLASVLQGVISQQLLRTYEGNSRIVAVEVLIATPAVRNIIREGKTHQLLSVMQAGARYGMQTMDQAITTLLKKGLISRDVALLRASSPAEIEKLLI
jgi:twitching motility protein PilT